MNLLKLQTIKESLIILSNYYLGKEPNQKEIKEINKIGQRLIESYQDINEDLLREIHKLCDIDIPYQRYSSFWKYIGYQNENPASDIRGGGLLSLDNLIYLLKTHPKMAKKMLHKQSRDNLTVDNQMESYPWAAVGINITRYIATEFEIIETSGRLKTSNFSSKTTWSYLTQPDGFNRLYCLAFFLLNSVWHEMKATYMQFPKVFQEMKNQFQYYLITSTSLSELELTIFHQIDYVYESELNYDYSSLPISSDVRDCTEDLLNLGDCENQIYTQTDYNNFQSYKNNYSKNISTTPDYLSSDFNIYDWNDIHSISNNCVRRRKISTNQQCISVV